MNAEGRRVGGRWLAAGVALALLAACVSSTLAQPAPAAPAKPASAPISLTPDDLVRVCGLDADQQAKLQVIRKEAAEALAKWHEANDAKLSRGPLLTDMAKVVEAEVKQRMMSRRSADWWIKDPWAAGFGARMVEYLTQAGEAVRPAIDEYVAIRKKMEAAVQALLTADQKAAWRARLVTHVADEVSASPAGRFSPTSQPVLLSVPRALGQVLSSLDEKQQAEIRRISEDEAALEASTKAWLGREAKLRQLAEAAAGEWVAAEEMGDGASAARAEIERKLYAAIMADCLTPEQRAAASPNEEMVGRGMGPTESESVDLIVRVHRLTETQRAALVDTIKAHDAALARWGGAMRYMASVAVRPDDPKERNVLAMLETQHRIISQCAFITFFGQALNLDQQISWSNEYLQKGYASRKSPAPGAEYPKAGLETVWRNFVYTLRGLQGIPGANFYAYMAAEGDCDEALGHDPNAGIPSGEGDKPKTQGEFLADQLAEGLDEDHGWFVKKAVLKAQDEIAAWWKAKGAAAVGRYREALRDAGKARPWMADDFFADLDPRACAETRAAVKAAIEAVEPTIREYLALRAGQEKRLAEMLALDPPRNPMGGGDFRGLKFDAEREQKRPLDAFMLGLAPDSVAEVCSLKPEERAALHEKAAARDKALAPLIEAAGEFAKHLIAEPGGVDWRLGTILIVKQGLIVTEAAAGIVASLSDAQREAWFLHAGYLKVLEIWERKDGPSEDQAAAIKAALAEYRKATRAAAGDSKEAVKVRAAAQVRLEEALLKVLGPPPGPK